jgi:outer membrane lipoprotein carrier protein
MGYGMLQLTMLAAGLALAVVPARQAPHQSAVELASAVQARYDSVRDFTADFIHIYVGGIVRKRVTEQGRLQVLKPGRMRWDYTEPDHKVFVSDGSQMYSYLPADRQVYVSPVPAQDQASTAVLFLAGKGNLLRDFDVRYAADSDVPSHAVALRLDPKLPERDYDWLVLVVDASSYQIRELVAADDQGGTSTFQFRNVHENVGLSDRIFEFRIPRGVDVIRGGN